VTEASGEMGLRTGVERFDRRAGHAWILQRPSTNLYVTEVQDGKRAQKLVFKGYVTK
jgi:hypothetical protein